MLAYLPVLTLILALTAVTRYWSLTGTYYTCYDEGPYLSAARLLWEGRAPFRDFPVKALPLVLGIALAWRLFGTGIFQGRLVSAMASSFTALLVYLIGGKMGGRTVGLLAALLYAVSLNAVAWSGVVVAEPLTIFFTALSVYLFVMAEERGSNVLYALSGATAGLASVTKITALVVLAYALYFGVRAVRAGGIKRALSKLGLIVASFGLTVVAFLIPFAFVSSIQHVYYVLFQHSYYHYQYMTTRNLQSFIQYLGQGWAPRIIRFVRSEPVHVAGCLGFALMLLHGTPRRDEMPLGVAVVAFWLMSFLAEVLITSTRKITELYLSQSVPALSLAAGYAICALLGFPNRITRRVTVKVRIATRIVGYLRFRLAALTFGVLACSLSLAVLLSSIPLVDRLVIAHQRRGEDFLVAEYIERHTEPGDHVFTVSPIYLFLADRPLPFDLPYPLIIVDAIRIPEERREMLNVPSVDDILSYLQSDRVRYVIVDHAMREKVWQYLPSEVTEYIELNFERVETIGSADIMARVE